METATRMGAIEAIESVSRVVEIVDAHRAAISREAHRAADQWIGLGRAGGHREDHAATLLGHLHNEIRAMVREMGDCVEMLDAIQADPFA